MSEPNALFLKDFGRKIETVIKADDKDNIYQEVDEYVITREISNKLANFFEFYNDKGATNGVWISGFFGSGKSHLLKILSHVLENKSLNGTHLGELFASKVTEDVKLKGDIQSCLRKIKSESILFNIDQQAQITAKSEENAILKVFYKVFYDHQGFYGFQPHIAEFEEGLSKEGKYEDFKKEFETIYQKPWVEVRMDYIKPLVNDAVAKACAKVYNDNVDNYKNYLLKWQSKHKQSIEDFALKVSDYIRSKEGNFRLNFFVDEVGQFIAEKTKLMLNLQTIAETLFTKCNGNSWVIVTSQEDLESLVGNDQAIQSDDFSKIQGRFKARTPLTSSNVDEVIEKRLLEKSDTGQKTLSTMFTKEGENIKTLISFTLSGLQFKGYQGSKDFVNKYPFLPYQFDLFQQCIKSLSRHNVFQGKHQSVGERSMLGVFQEVLKSTNFDDPNTIISYDQLFDGILGTLRSEAQNSILLAKNQLTENPIAIRVLKVLFLIKYYDSFKGSARNISVLLIDNLKVNLTSHNKQVEDALNLLEQQSYIQLKGDVYEYLTDDEKDIEEEIKNTTIDNGSVSQLINEIVFDGIVRDNKIRYSLNKQEFEFARKVDGVLFGREKELKFDIITPNNDLYDHIAHFNGSTLADTTLMMVKLPADKRLIYEVRMYLKTIKYIKQSQSSSNKEAVTRILYEKGQQNLLRKKLLETSLNELLAKSIIYLNGIENKSSTSSDGRTRILETAQDLILIAYHKLQLLGSGSLDENQLRIIMSNSGLTLFKDENNSLSAAQQEVFSLITRRKEQHDRTSLSDLRDHFSKKPYGWPQLGIWCVVALLFKQGKIEARNGLNLLDDKGMLDVLDNNRTWLSTIISPQTIFEQNDIHLLKKVYQDAFNETNPHTEAKEVAALFKTKALDEERNIRNLLREVSNYAFLKSLQPLADLLNKLGSMDYATLINSIRTYEDKLLDDKEDIYDPIMQFWNGEQKKIFDKILIFQNGNQANFDHIVSTEKQLLADVLKSAEPYKGNVMKQAKDTMDILSKRILTKIKEERQLVIDAANFKLLQLQNSYDFKEATPDKQELAQKPFQNIISKAKVQNYIANLKVDRDRLNELFTEQLNMLSQAKPIKTTETGGGVVSAPPAPPIVKFMDIKNVEKHVKIGKQQLESLDDVDLYISALRKEMEDKINANIKITLN